RGDRSMKPGRENAAGIHIGAGLSGYVAEMNAAFCCASLGIVPTVRHADYIGSWLQVLREDNRAIVRAASQASKAADWLLAHAPEGAAHVVTADELERRVA
ncbi:zincin-like metallopeptidase domain-containing protein, partial [Sphingomonas paucimobilis]|uniref:zincin-like metallopeptidase domain-containing protein n=1 Tax=Sphingomonas paucimobilis TaxID=13689 RepID=UPI002434D50E